MEPPDLAPRSPNQGREPGRDDGDGREPSEPDLEPRPPVITPDPLATRLVPGELAILSVVAAIVLVAGWVALELAGMITAPAGPAATPPTGSAAPTQVAGTSAPSGQPSTPASAIPATPSPVPSPSFGVLALDTGTPLTGRWRRIAEPMIGGRSHAAVAWTGAEVLVWGGFNGEARWGDGAAYDPAANRWRRLPRSPMTARMAPAAVWTGSEFLVWGGYRVRFAVDGAAYDPAANEWRALPEAPLTPGPAGGAWTGSRFVVVTGAPSAAAYDPTRNAWQPLDAPPVAAGSLELVSVGERVFVVRRAFDPGEPISIAELIDGEGAWRSLPDGPIAGDGAARPAISAGGWIVVGDAAFDPATGAWSVVAAGACAFSTEIAAADGPRLLTPAAAIDLGARTCQPLPRIPNRPGGGTRVASISAWTGTDWIVWSGGSGEPGVLFPNDGVAFRPASP